MIKVVIGSDTFNDWLPLKLNVMSGSIFNPDLVQQSNFEHWIAIEKSSKKADWRFLPQSIQQQATSGSTSLQSGSLLIKKNAFLASNSSLVLGLQPGKTGHSGLVFNFIDADNFSLFLVNQGKTGSKNHSIQILQIANGRDTELFRENRAGSAQMDTTLRIVSVPVGSEFYYNDALQFRAEGISLAGAFGLYTRGNPTTNFTELRSSVVAQKQVPTSGNPTAILSNTPSVPVSKPIPVNIENSIQADQTARLKSFLGIKPPAAKTTVDFREVLTVALDSFYSALSEKFNNHDGGNGTANTTNVELLDLRPRQWYRRLREINDLLLLQKGVEVKKKLLCDSANARLQKQLDVYETDHSITEESISQLEIVFNGYVGEHLEARRISEALLDQKAGLMREIRTNGYFLDDVLGEEKVLNAGYDFVIRKAKYGLPAFEPIEFDPQGDFSNDALWIETEEKLFARAKEVMKTKNREQYEKEKALLVSAQTCVSLQLKLATARAALSTAEANKAAKDSQLNAIDAEIAAWGRDVSLMDGRIGAFADDGYQYTTSGWDRELNVWLRTGQPLGTSQSTNDYVTNNIIGSQFPGNQEDRRQTWGFHRIRFTHCTLLARRVERLVNWPNLAPFENLLATYVFLVIDYPEFGIQRNAQYLHFEEGNYTTMFYWIGWDHVVNIFETAKQVCVTQINFLQGTKPALVTDQGKLLNEIQLLRDSIDKQTKEGLSAERKNFIQKWNSPQAYQGDFQYETVYPDADPLAEFMISTAFNQEKEAVTTYIFTPTENGYVNQYGQGILDFLQSSNSSLENTVALFPVADGSGDFSGDLIKVVRNPKKSTKLPSLPIIKFVESYKITIGWLGFSLGELSHSINLVPGESKELVVEKKTKITTKTELTRKEETNRSEKLTSSFEDNLQDTFSAQNKSDLKSEDKTKGDSSNSGSTNSQSSNETTSKFDWNMSAGGSFFGASVNAGMSGGNTRTNKNSLDNKTAFSIAQSNEGLRASNQSSDILKKNVSNTIRKVANETSVNNKVEFASVSSTEVSTEVADKEIIKLENPNVGRTVNYNFFQLQNNYGVTLSLTDVKIVLNTGQELIDGTGINDIRVYEAEEFGKIYPNSDQKAHDKYVASVIARQVMKNYGDFLAGVTRGNGAITLPQGFFPDREALEVLNFSALSLTDDFSAEALQLKIDSALDALKGMPFYFRETMVQSETTLAVNAGAYHLEAQVGQIPATEQYLEDRRNTESEMQRAKVAHLQQQTKMGVFFPELPASLTQLGNAPERSKRINPETTID